MNATFVSRTEERASADDAVSAACIGAYRQRLSLETDEHPLHDLTRHLIDTSDETAAAIRARMSAKWAGDPEAARKIESSVTNSLRRSAGTNYQTLVTYAIARHLLKAHSHWYVLHPVPSEWAQSLSIMFTAGRVDDAAGKAPDEPQDVTIDVSLEDHDPPAEAGVIVKPDLDILLRNASWTADQHEKEPVLVLSVKTSLADRAGAAARWKTYFDLVTNPCDHVCEESCAYRRLGIKLAYDPAVHITHGIVTANIYKINSDPFFTKFGELRSNQSRANTFVFDSRYTTREESEEVMAEGWTSLVHLTEWLAGTSRRCGLPL